MVELIFNKMVTSKKGSDTASVIFRKLTKISKHDRYQGSINTVAIKLIKAVCKGSYSSLQVSFSDEHSIVGFKPEPSSEGRCTGVFGATQLFDDLNLKVGVYYKLTTSGEYVVFDSNEHV